MIVAPSEFDVKFVVLSDLHLTPPGVDLLGLDPYARFQAAIARINATHSDAACVVLAGDVTDRSRTAAFEDLARALEDLDVPRLITLGNHDNRDVFAKVFGAAALDENGFAQGSCHAGDQVMIALDTLEKGPDKGGWGRSEGHLCQRRLDWLARELERAGGKPVHLAFHHPVLQVSPRHDPFLLHNPETLLEMFADYGNVRSVTTGHIHMTTTSIWRGIPFHTIAGGFTTSREGFGQPPYRTRLEGPAQMAVILSDADRTVVHFDDYVDGNGAIAAGVKP